MRLVLIVAIVCLVMATGSGAGASPNDAFVGTWWVVDTTDGSLEQATFGAAGSLFFRDDPAHACGGAAALATDTGTVSGGTWTGSGTATLRCAQGAGDIGDVFFQFTANGDGTLSSSVTLPTESWTRTRPLVGRSQP
jgi:hypothetical protein